MSCFLSVGLMNSHSDRHLPLELRPVPPVDVPLLVCLSLVLGPVDLPAGPDLRFSAAPFFDLFASFLLPGTGGSKPGDRNDLLVLTQ